MKLLRYHGIELLDVGAVTIYYLIFGFAASLALDHLLNNISDKEEKYESYSTARLGIEITIHIVLLSLVFYGLRLFIRKIPFPFDGRANYNHSALYEIDGGVVLVFVILFFQRQLIEKVGVFQNRIREALGLRDVSVS